MGTRQKSKLARSPCCVCVCLYHFQLRSHGTTVTQHAVKVMPQHSTSHHITAHHITSHHKNLTTSNFQPYVTTGRVHRTHERLERAAMPLGPLVTGFLTAQHSLGSKYYVTSLDCWTLKMKATTAATQPTTQRDIPSSTPLGSHCHMMLYRLAKRY
jgi:hypothetical protein